VTVTAPLEMVGAIEHFVEAGVIGGKRSRHVNEWVVADTAFREAHVKGALKTLELLDPRRLHAINAPATRKRGTYADAALLLEFPSTR
jgi:hypothetical protein